MGGSGGYFSQDDVDSIIKELKKSEEHTQNAELDAAVAKVIDTLLIEYNDRDEEKIKGYLDSIKSALSKDIEGTVDLIFGGSVLKHTYVDGLSDIDSLVLLDNCELASVAPHAAKDYLVKRLQERFPHTTIHEGDLAVTMYFKDAQIQLVPAIRCNQDVSISNANGNGWLHIRPKEFSKALTEANKKVNGRLVPMIKIAKAINSKLSPTQQLSGYHIESIAIEVFRNYNGPNTTKNLLRHFFQEAPSRVLSPIKDKTGQNIHVDDYLGATESFERKFVANAFSRIGKRMKNADVASSLEEWVDILS